MQFLKSFFWSWSGIYFYRQQIFLLFACKKVCYLMRGISLWCRLFWCIIYTPNYTSCFCMLTAPAFFKGRVLRDFLSCSLALLDHARCRSPTYRSTALQTYCQSDTETSNVWHIRTYTRSLASYLNGYSRWLLFLNESDDTD